MEEKRTCRRCNGSKVEVINGVPIKCRPCGGRGYLILHKCSFCGGSGISRDWYNFGERCYFCGGSGYKP